MDFAFDATQMSVTDTAFKFSQKVLNAGARERCRQQRFDRQLWERCGGQGLLGMSVPQTHGGSGFDALTTAGVMEALGRGCEDAGLLFSIAAHLFACVMPIAEFGSGELKARYLPKLCSGQWVGANAITESEAGSDAFALRCRAVSDNGGYVLNGAKEYVTNGPVADVAIIYATINPAFGYLGVTAFIVEKGFPNFSRGQAIPKMGLTTSQTGSLYLDDCRVPAGQRLGGEGQGGAIFRRSMLWERSCLFGLYLGMMERQLDQAVRHARERRQFGRSIGKNQGLAHRIANMKLRLEAARLLLYKACWCLDQGRDALLEVSMAKLAISEAAIQSGLDCIQVHGGMGYAGEAGIEAGLRDAIPGTIFSGTSEIQRDLIAKELGL